MMSSSVLRAQQTAQSSGNRTVILHLSVTASGGYASGIKRDSFVVYDNGVAQKITFFKDGSVPASIAFVVDTTEHLSILKSGEGNVVFQAIGRGISEFAKLSPQESEYCLFGFDDQPRMLANWTNDVTAVGDTTARLKSKGWPTSLYDACLAALDQLAQRKNQKRVIIIICSGFENKSRHRFDDLRRVLRTSDILVYSMEVEGMYSTNHMSPQLRSELVSLTDLTGGVLRTPFDSESVREDLGQLAFELQHQYLIGFESASTSTDGYHDVKVKLQPTGNTAQELKGLEIRSRRGYIAEK
jgi:VWFA-related protein